MQLENSILSENSYQPNSIYETSPEQDKILKLLFKNIYINGGLLIFDYAKIIDGFGDHFGTQNRLKIH